MPKVEIEVAKMKALQGIETAKGEAKEMDIKTPSINNKILKLKTVEKWDGHLPNGNYQGNSIPWVVRPDTAPSTLSTPYQQ